MTNAVVKLIDACNAERKMGWDFPTIWKTTLKGHPYVRGQPIQDSGEDGPILKVPLTTGQFIVFLGSHFSLW